MFIPMSFMQKEAQHVAGFAPELAVVTHGGGEKLEEPLVVRPTSETIIGHMYAQWIQSYRDLPLLINLWNSVVRWEMRTRLFLRTLEFLWQEGHTAHATYEDAEEETKRMLGVYVDFAENDAAIPVLKGRKSESEKFAGAMHTYAIEALMGDKKALQAGTSHNLGQNFAQAFDIQYLDRDNVLKHCWTTSWGLSSRMIGAIVMVHGDDQGLILPPKLAPTQVIVIPIWRDEAGKQLVMEAVARLKSALTAAQVTLKVDDREEYTAGWKFNEWEMRGVPLRLEIGPRDVAQNQVVLVRRDTGEKTTAPQESLVQTVSDLLADIQANLFRRALKFRQDNTLDLDDYAGFKFLFEGEAAGGFVRAWWCGAAACEAQIKEDTKATIRCIPFDQPGGTGKCIYCGSEAKEKAVFAKAY
jgi:prolyl-tRNA synthetase